MAVASSDDEISPNISSCRVENKNKRYRKSVKCSSGLRVGYASTCQLDYDFIALPVLYSKISCVFSSLRQVQRRFSRSVTQKRKEHAFMGSILNMEYAVIIHQAVSRLVSGMHSEADG